jgi:hypothetical protein
MNIKYLLANRLVRNEHAYIVGKGVSLRNLSETHFPKPTGNIIAINEAIVALERLIGLPNNIFSMQKDGASPYHRNECQCALLGHSICPHAMVRPAWPNTILLTHELESSDCMLDHFPRYTFNNESYGLRWYSPSVISALKIAKQLGAKNVTMIAFDSFTSGEHLTYNPAQEINVTTSNYSCQHEAMLEELKTFESFEFITPKEEDRKKVEISVDQIYLSKEELKERGISE